MYNEEKVIDGVLCWRGTPTGEWRECSQENLTRRLLFAEKKLKSYAKSDDEINNLLKVIENTYSDIENERIRRESI